MAARLNGLKWGLWPLGVVHGAAVWCRNRLYDRHWLPVHQLPRPVISVGNLQLGGTGKTPLTAQLIEALEARDLRVAVLTRGYRRRSRSTQIVPACATPPPPVQQLGDEPLLLFRRLRKGILGVGSDRYRTAQQILAQHPVDVFLLDDGFQHRRLARDLDICLVDFSRWPAHPLLFPVSELRDLKSSLRRADVVLHTGPAARAAQVQAWVARTGRQDQPWFAFRKRPAGWVDLRSGRPVAQLNERDRPAGAICGLACPTHFWHSLQAQGLNPVWRRGFPDHHWYRLPDLQAILRARQRYGFNSLLTTEKDALKLAGLVNHLPADLKLFYLKIEMQVEQFPRLLALIVDRLGAYRR